MGGKRRSRGAFGSRLPEEPREKKEKKAHKATVGGGGVGSFTGASKEEGRGRGGCIFHACSVVTGCSGG